MKFPPTRLPKTLILFLLAISFAFTLPARAQPGFVGPGLSPDRPDVEAGSPRHGSVAAGLSRHHDVGVKPPLRHADLKVGATAATPAKPFTQEQVATWCATDSETSRVRS